MVNFDPVFTPQPFFVVQLVSCQEHRIILPSVILQLQRTYHFFCKRNIFVPSSALEGIYQDQRMEFSKKPFNILGIHFAPLSLPLERRLQVNISFGGIFITFLLWAKSSKELFWLPLLTSIFEGSDSSQKGFDSYSTVLFSIKYFYPPCIHLKNLRSNAMLSRCIFLKVLILLDAP